MEITRECKDYRTVLLRDEQVEWEGRSGSFPLMTPENRANLIFRWIFCAALLVILSASYIAATVLIPTKFHVQVILILLVVFAYAGILPVLDWKNIQKKTRYVVTNKRVILASGKNVFALNRSGIHVECKKTAEGGVHILFGSCTKASTHKYRYRVIVPESDSSDLSKNGFVFYNVVEGQDRLKELLSI